MFRVNAPYPIAIHSWGFFIWKNVFISANRLLASCGWYDENSLWDLGLLNFPEVRLSLPNVAIPIRCCFCVHSWKLLMANSPVRRWGAWAIKIVSLVSCEVWMWANQFGMIDFVPVNLQVWVTAGREMEDYSEKCRKECEDRLSGVWSEEDGARVIIKEKTEHPSCVDPSCDRPQKLRRLNASEDLSLESAKPDIM